MLWDNKLNCLIIFCVLTWFSIDLILWNTYWLGILVFSKFYSELIYFHCWAPSFSKLTVSFGHLENELGFYIWQLIFKISTCNCQFFWKKDLKTGENKCSNKISFKLFLNIQFIYAIIWLSLHIIGILTWSKVKAWTEATVRRTYMEMAWNSLKYLILLKII